MDEKDILCLMCGRKRYSTNCFCGTILIQTKE